MCEKPETEEKDNSHKEFLLELIDLLIRRLIIKHNTRQLPKSIQCTAVASKHNGFSNTNSMLAMNDIKQLNMDKINLYHIKID